MKRRYKVIFNVEVDDPEKPFPAGGDYTHLNRIEGIVRRLRYDFFMPDIATITLDKVIDKGIVMEGKKTVSERHDELTTIQVTPQIKLSLHQSELFGPRYQFNLLLDQRHNFAFTVADARSLHAAWGQLLTKIEDK